MSQPPPGHYDYTPGRKQQAHGSPSYFQPNDPYRAVRKSTTPDSNDSDAFHSRAESDSSTSRLANGPQRGSLSGGHDPYDPYAVPPRQPTEKKKKHRRKHDVESQEYRANSYLPYSHHERADPFATPDPVYIEEENLPSFVAPGKDGVGSLLQDNIAMDTVSDPANTQQPHHSLAAAGSATLPEIKRRKKKRRCCGIPRRTMVLITFVFVILVAVAWFFVWPRFPDALAFQEANVPDGIDPVNEKLIIQTVWNTSFTLDNTENWVPTRIQGFDVRAVDMDTGREIGKGSTSSMVLPGRQSLVGFNVMIKIDYSSSKEDDTTLNNLIACTMPREDPGPAVTESLNVAFYVKIKISGIAWNQEASVRPNAFKCPTP